MEVRARGVSAVPNDRHQIRPRRSLLGPRPRVGHCPEGALGHRLGAVHGFEGQDSCLEVGRQEQEAEELGDPRRVSPSFRTTSERSAMAPQSIAA